MAVHVHLQSPNIETKLDKILDKLGITDQTLRRLMATQQELLQELVEINATTDELSTDVDALILKADNPAEKEAVKAELVTLKTRLQGIASKYTPEVLADPNNPNPAARKR